MTKNCSSANISFRKMIFSLYNHPLNPQKFKPPKIYAINAIGGRLVQK